MRHERDGREIGRAQADLGAALMQQERLTEAIAAYAAAVAVNPGRAAEWLAEANYKMARVLRQRGDDAGAEAALREVIALRPDWPTAHVGLGMVLKDTGRLEEALRCHHEAVRLDPRSAAAWTTLGVALHAVDEFEAAEAAHRKAIALAPEAVEPCCNLGRLMHDLGRLDEARALHEAAVARAPDDGTARFNLATALLLDGDFARGFAEYEWRRRPGVLVPAVRSFAVPEWRGEPLHGRTLLLHAEQGLGDTLQFVRFVPVVAAHAARIVLEVQAPLAGLLARSLPGVAVVAAGTPLPPHDCHLPLLSLPVRLGTTLDTLPAAVPYLRPAPDTVAAWRERLAARAGLKVGLVWAGNPKHRFDRRRSLPLARLLPHLPAGGVALHSLQKDLRPDDRAALAGRPDIVDLSGALGDFSDTAAVVAALDLVVSVDSAVAHLSGALAKPTLLLTPHALDWRWLRDRADSPWYPTMRLIRQSRAGDWSDVLVRLQEALRAPADAAVV
ncbi:tetratricopeptide repeat protein [Rhodoplanes sp. TEM]|uniref:Tetratricopeptide repeat protein n=1 Tax=Rhodoplanes tepidamans TaxID=200616 RepID=A0ABT5JAR7_RHOTP|nr:MULTISPECIES: tetratricopeptide repeat protein [Rhodoplanes]MDC7786687.1 tetratricopeptide repeat protein [Rhodoplanes tepidamans]MDC7987083.1 tetratricopeptide repeat protein [Rhodoplanes sp. TEM]MDQ0356348.1 Flp pilus assembly protein TadD [Rhodoplanes tepidamans]